jgi:hypothetical protein
VTHEYGGCEGGFCKRHLENVYSDEDDGDMHYSAYVRQEIAHVPDGAVTRFVTRARWDAGLGVVTELVGADGSAGAVEYDALGRYRRAFGPNPETGELCSEPMKEVFYHLETAPMPYLETWVNTSKEILLPPVKPGSTFTGKEIHLVGDLDGIMGSTSGSIIRERECGRDR